MTARQRGHDGDAHDRDASLAARIIADSPLATVVLAPDLRVQSWNRAAEELFGWTANELVGLPGIPMVPAGREDEAREFQRRLQAGETLAGVETVRLAKDGTAIDVAIYGSAFGRELGGGIAVRFVDLRDRRRLEALAREDATRTERRRRREQAIAEFFASVANTSDEGLVLRELASHVVTGLPALAVVWRLAADEASLSVAAAASPDAGLAKAWRALHRDRVLEVGEGIPGRVAKTGEALFEPSLDGDAVGPGGAVAGGPGAAMAVAGGPGAAVSGPGAAVSGPAWVAASVPSDRRDAIAALRPRAVIAVPLEPGGTRVGVLVAARLGSDDEILDGDEPFDGDDFEFVRTLAARGGVALEAAAARRELRDEATRSAILAQFLSAASEASDQSGVLEQLARRTAEALDGTCSVFRLDPDGRKLEAVALAGAEPEREAALRSMFATLPWRADEGTMGRTVRTGETVFRAYMPADEREAYLRSLPEDRRAAMEGIDLRAIVTVGLSMSGERIGVLSLARYGPSARPFTERDRAFAEELASRADLALARLALAAERTHETRRAHLIAEFVQDATDARDERELLERLSQAASDAVDGSLAVYRLTADGRELDTIALTSHDETADAFRAMYAVQRWRADEGFMGLALTSRRPVFRPYLSPADREAYLATLPEDRRGSMAERDLRAIIAIPLLDRGAPIGILTLARYGRDAQPFGEADRAFAEDLASRANLALSRLALDAERERDARQMRILAAFLERVAGANGDEDAILQHLADAAASEMGDWCDIKLVAPDGMTLELRAVAARDPALSEMTRALFAAHSLPTSAAIDRDVIESGRSVLATVDPAELRASVHAGFRALFVRDFTSRLVVPLRLQGRVAGDILLLREAASPPYDEADLRFVEDLARRAALAVERHRAERARAEAAAELRRTSQTLQAILDASPLPVMAVDLGRRMTYWNKASERLYGWTADEALGRPPLYVVPGEPDPLSVELPRIAGGESIVLDDVRRQTKSGDIVPVRLFAAPVRGADGRVTAMIGIHEDLRERKELEAELRRTTGFLTAILDASPMAIMAVDEEMRVTYWNRAAEELYGWTADEVLGEPPPFAPPGDPGLLESTYARVRAGEIVAQETERRTKAGRTIEVRIRNAPLYDEEGRFRGGLGMHEDITERRRLEAELLQAQKMETVGRLAGGVAHDFNNILTAIIGYSDLGRSMTGEPEVGRILETVKASAERAAGLTQQLLAFSRRQMLRPQTVEANEVVLGMESILRRLIGEDIELVASVTPDAGSIVVDRTQLEQVILNLAVNARDAMPEGGRLVLRTEATHFNGNHTHLEMAPGDYVVISVSDTGTGMDDEIKAHIFEPFFTTKEVGKGTGLGLATTYGIVRQSGGYIWVYSEPGRGTTFKLYFPRVGGQAQADAAPAPAAGQRRGRILLVEDEPMLRDLARLVLSRRGFEVVAANGPAHAYELAGEDETFDLLLTDVVMPGATGIELARRLRERRPSLRVLFMSGYSEDVTDSAGSMTRRFLAKPFTPDSLLRAVDEAIGSEAPER